MTDEQPYSGYQALIGWEVKERQPGEVKIELALTHHHLNRSDYVHGGVLASLLDTAMSFAGLYSPAPQWVRKAVTLSMTTTFVSPVQQGTLTVIGRVRGGGRKTFMSTGEVFDEQGKLIAFGEGSFRLRTGSELDPA
ncbi:PaaI family thioesterase [Saccharospirillum impatiens]|uniref:PaaI family thioesterase n=1 Tax=Saccharospirillum impatiens TaxID=169438 RepID=UPI0003F57207|nr:PaaI family thioesterase [Saccharospirillum impatiens]